MTMHSQIGDSGHDEPNEESQIRNGDQVEVRAELSHISASSIKIVTGDAVEGDAIYLNVHSADQAREIMKMLKEDRAARSIPAPPSAEAPLQVAVDHWFQHCLTDEERYFAVTLSLFSGLKYPDFRDICRILLEAAVSEDAEDRKKRSPFLVPDDELLEHVKAEVVRGDDGPEHIVRFADARYVSAVFDLMCRRHRNVLLDLLPALKEVGERYRYWPVRTRSSLAVAEISRVSFQRVRSQVLEPWARDPRSYVRATVGYAVARLVQSEDSRAAVISMLNDWIDESWTGPGEVWRYRWTAASAFKQVGISETQETRDWAYEGLNQLAGFDDIRIGDSVIHSLVLLSIQGQLERVLREIKVWIEQGSAGRKAIVAPQVRCIVSLLAFVVISEIHIELAQDEIEDIRENGIYPGDLFELVCQSERCQGEYWQLAVAVGVRAFEFHLPNIFFTLIERWTKYAANMVPRQNVVRNLLFEVYLRARPLNRQHIWNRLGMWERQNKDIYLSEMARSAKAKVNQHAG